MKDPNKDFDCVEMKHKIQAKILEKMKSYPSEQEYKEARLKKFMNDPYWSKVIKSAQ